MVVQIAMKVFGNDCTISMAAADGELELNVWESVILTSVLESAGLLCRGLPILCEKCISGITVNEEQCQVNAESSLALSTAIARVFDYPTASKVAHRAAEEQLTVREVAVQDGLMNDEQARRLLDPSNMVDSEVFERVIAEMKGLAHK